MIARKCLFPAAGYGTRFLPATKAMPKEMLPIVNRPLIEFGVAEANAAGMSDICIVTGRGKRPLEDYFDVNFELEHQIAGFLRSLFSRKPENSPTPVLLPSSGSVRCGVWAMPY